MILVGFLGAISSLSVSVLEKSFSNQTMQNTLPPRNQCQDRSFVLGRGWGGFNAIIDDHSSLKENRNAINTVYL